AKLAAIIVLAVSVALGLSVESASSSRAEQASSITSTICSVLGAADKVSLPHDLYSLAAHGEVDALGAILFGSNIALCGTGEVKGLSLPGRNFTTPALSQKPPASGQPRGSPPPLAPNPQPLPLPIPPVSAPAVTFSQVAVGFGRLVPLTV